MSIVKDKCLDFFTLKGCYPVNSDPETIRRPERLYSLNKDLFG